METHFQLTEGWRFESREIQNGAPSVVRRGSLLGETARLMSHASKSIVRADADQSVERWTYF